MRLRFADGGRELYDMRDPDLLIGKRARIQRFGVPILPTGSPDLLPQLQTLSRAIDRLSRLNVSLRVLDWDPHDGRSFANPLFQECRHGYYGC